MVYISMHIYIYEYVDMYNNVCSDISVLNVLFAAISTETYSHWQKALLVRADRHKRKLIKDKEQ